MTSKIIETLTAADLIIAVGSTDGILTAAATKRLGGGKAEVVFTQAFTVDRLPVDEWHDRKVVLVDLAVNSRQPDMTAEFVRRLRAGGNTLLAVVDEHSREEWLTVLGSFEGLVIEPQSQGAEGGPGSSGEVLRRALEEEGVEIDSHTAEMLAAADEADRMNFTSRLGGIVNSAVKSRIQDDTRRVYLANHFAKYTESDLAIQEWIAEYDAIIRNNAEVIAEAIDLGDQIVRVTARGRRIDMTSLMAELYSAGWKVTLVEDEFFDKAVGRKRPMVGFGLARGVRLDLVEVMKDAGVTAGGFAAKANVDLSDEEKALTAVRAALTA